MTLRTDRPRRRARNRPFIPRPDIEDVVESPPHPGEILLEEFLRPAGVSQTALAVRIHVPLQRLHDLVRGRRGVTPDTALRLARALGTSTEFWLNLQTGWDLWHAVHDPASADIADIEPLALR